MNGEPDGDGGRRTTMNARWPRLFLALLVLVSTVVVACGDGDTVASSDRGSAREKSPTQPEASPPPFTLYVSNQSFDEPTVGITITIDGEVVVDEDFDVEGQHNWIKFEPDVAAGDHTLSAVSSTGAELTVEFSVPEGEARWAVVDYWLAPRRLSFNINDEPMGLA